MNDNAKSDFIESLGLILQNDGLPRIAGRLLGVFVLYGGPFSFSELCEKLRVSRGSVSTNTRLLVDLGAIERVGIPGERQDYFRLSENPYAQLLERWMNRSREARNTINRAATAVLDCEQDMKVRMEDLSNFYRVLERVGGAALNDLRHSEAQAGHPALMAGE